MDLESNELDKNKRWYQTKSCRLLSMLGLTASFFVVEISVGYITNSLALVGDAYHMLSDVIALLIGIAAVRVRFWLFHFLFDPIAPSQ